jgi:Icc-related predicted phosphoesterase
MAAKEKVRLVALGDTHYTKNSQGSLQPVLAQIPANTNFVLLCGDLTDHGLPEEATLLLRELTAAVKLPMVGVLGNHDFEAGKEAELARIFTDAGIHLLDGTGVEIQGIGFAGVKGFAGGFGQRALEPWGEQAIKLFVREALDETLKLESALARLRTGTRIAVLHYAPIAATVQGEPLEIYPFLGSSRLEEPLNRYPVTAVVHGHAHRGAPEGKTRGGIPVYNVALPLLRRAYPNQPPFRVLDVPLVPPDGHGADGGNSPSR